MARLLTAGQAVISWEMYSLLDSAKEGMMEIKQERVYPITAPLRRALGGVCCCLRGCCCLGWMHGSKGSIGRLSCHGCRGGHGQAGKVYVGSSTSPRDRFSSPYPPKDMGEHVCHDVLMS